MEGLYVKCKGFYPTNEEITRFNIHLLWLTTPISIYSEYLS